MRAAMTSSSSSSAASSSGNDTCPISRFVLDHGQLSQPFVEERDRCCVMHIPGKGMSDSEEVCPRNDDTTVSTRSKERDMVSSAIVTVLLPLSGEDEAPSCIAGADELDERISEVVC